MLQRALQFVASVIVVALIAQLVAACVIPGHTMTAAEHACCMKMASMCNSSAMPMSHSCCQKGVAPQAIALANVRGGDLAVPAILTSETAPAILQLFLSNNLHYAGSPPGGPPKLSSVLRI